jgi:hypothetical protein
MGVRRSQVKNKKSASRGAAAAVKREESLRKVARDTAKRRTQGMR